MARERQPKSNMQEGPSFDDNVVKVYRCAKVVKGGRRFSFGALVVVGDRNGRVGFGYGKANEVPSAVEKGRKAAVRSLAPVTLTGSTIPHAVLGRFGSSRVKLLPATEGTGVIAGASVRAVLELAGVKDCLTKVYGATSPKNLVKATMHALQTLRDRSVIESLRGVSIAL
jgi:small subunit ribosomal protein S5